MTTSTVLFFIALACMLVVVGSLVMGVVAMTRGHEKDHKTSNKMMQMRVLFQGLTIFFLFLSYMAR